MATTKWSEIRRSKIPDEAAEQAVAASGRALRDALALYELRRQRGVTQVAIAERLNIRQGSVSEMERRPDVYISSLRDYIAALGGELEINAVFDGERIPISIGDERLLQPV